MSKMLPNELVELANNACKIKAETQTTEVKAAHYVFENRRNEFVVTFYNQSGAQNLTQQSEPVKSGTLLEFCAVPRTRQEIANFLGVQTVFYAVKHYVQPLLTSGKLQMTIPDKPKSRSQKYVAAQAAEEA